MSALATIPILLLSTAQARKQTSEPAHASGTTLVGVINQALPSAPPPADTPEFTCEVTWDLLISGGGTLNVSSDCPMAAEVREAAEQWRFGYMRAREGQDAVHIDARFVYGPDKNETVGWYYLMGPEPRSSQVEAQPSEVHAVKRVNPIFTESMHHTGLTSVACDARFSIDDRGMPRQVEVYGCPDIYQQSVLEAAGKWRFDARGLAPGVETGFILHVQFELR